MLKRLATAALLFCAALAPGFAADFVVPAKNPIARVTIPDSWETEETDLGTGAISPDSGVSLLVEQASASGDDKRLAANDAWLQQNDITPKGPHSEQESTIAGLPAKIYSYPAADDEGDTIVDFIVLRPSDGQMILLTLWASAREREANKAELDAIKTSIKPIN